MQNNIHIKPKMQKTFGMVQSPDILNVSVDIFGTYLHLYSGISFKWLSHKICLFKDQ